MSCFVGETGVMTNRGVQPIADLAGGIHELLAADGKWIKVPIRSFGQRNLMRVRLSRNGVEKVIHSAPGHRWLLRTHSSGGVQYWGKRPDEVTTIDLVRGDRLAWSFPMRPDGMVPDRMGAASGFVSAMDRFLPETGLRRTSAETRTRHCSISSKGLGVRSARMAR